MKSKDPDLKWNWLQRAIRPTRWSVIARARQGSGAETERDLNDFCRSYWHPLYDYLRHSGYSESDAKDYVQSFLAVLVEKNLLATADSEKGRLRSYLLTLLNRHVASLRRRDRAQKRGGGVRHVAVDAAFDESALRDGPRVGTEPEEAYRRALAGQLVAEGIAALRKHYAASGRSALLEEILSALEGPLQESNYAQVASRLGMRTPAIRTAVVRMRERFRIAVKVSASGVLGIPDGPLLDAELHDLFCAPLLPPQP